MRRRATALSFSIVLLLASGAVSWLPAAAMQEASPNIMRFWWGDGFPDMLEPQQTESGTVDMTFLNYEGRTRFDEELNVVPAAAESWEFNADGTRITFRLRDNLTYSDGARMLSARQRSPSPRAQGRAPSGRRQGVRDFSDDGYAFHPHAVSSVTLRRSVRL